VVNQAMISALLVVMLQPPNDVFDPVRFLDALMGGGAAVAISYLLPINPECLVERAARPIFDELVVVLADIAAGLKNSDHERTERALLRARSISDDQVRSFYGDLAAGHVTAQLSPTRRRALEHLKLYANADTRIYQAVINTRVLARSAANATRGYGPAAAAGGGAGPLPGGEGSGHIPGGSQRSRRSTLIRPRGRPQSHRDI
jgi:uncharacterized membrane protein YgaE (UPF0421/DUF939 family)